MHETLVTTEQELAEQLEDFLTLPAYTRLE